VFSDSEKMGEVDAAVDDFFVVEKYGFRHNEELCYFVCSPNLEPFSSEEF
jgi:hypothetical protein